MCLDVVGFFFRQDVSGALTWVSSGQSGSCKVGPVGDLDVQSPPVSLTVMSLFLYVSLRLRESRGGEGGVEAEVVTDTSVEASCRTLTKGLSASAPRIQSVITGKRFSRL